MDKSLSKTLIKCCVKNCRKEIPLEEAMKIEGRVFCKVCGVHYYRNVLGL